MVKMVSIPLLKSTPSHPIYDSFADLFHLILPSSIQPSSNSPFLTWQPGKTPLSTFPHVVLALSSYLAIIFGGREIIKRAKVGSLEKWLKTPFLIHNLLLTVGSGMLLACMLEEILPRWYKYGFFHAICAAESYTDHIERLYLLNYYFKYWELVDTGFLVLKKKPLAFLHVYHHSATALLCFSQLMGRTSVSWVVITLNLMVHVLMYFYYALTSLKIPCPWKRAVTTLQITQFILDLSVVYFASYQYFVGRLGLPLPRKGACAANGDHAVLSGVAILTSYLFLFISFYRKTYNAKAAKATKARKEAAAAASGSSSAIKDSNGSAIKRPNPVNSLPVPGPVPYQLEINSNPGTPAANTPQNKNKPLPKVE